MRVALLVAGLAMTGAASAGAPPPPGRPVAILNDSNSAMIRLQARAPKTATWPLDILGQYGIGVGLTGKATMPQGAACVYDLLASFDDGSKTQLLGIDTCKPGPVVFKAR